MKLHQVTVSAGNGAGAAAGTFTIRVVPSEAAIIPTPGSFRIARLAADAREITVRPSAGSFIVSPASNGGSDPDPNPTKETNAAPADDFVEALAINTHVNWGNAWAGTSWRQLLIDLGIRYHRTMVGGLSQSKGHIDWLHANGGMKVLALCARNRAADGDATYPVYDFAEVANYISFLGAQIGPAKLIGVEGPNEDNRPAKTSSWEERIRDVQQHIWDTVRGSADPSFAALPVVATSVYRRDVDDAAALGDFTGRADRANIHYYTNGFTPTQGNARLNGITSQMQMDSVLEYFEAMVPGAPLWVTEYGHPVRTIDGYAYGLDYMTPLASAKYGLRGIAEFFSRGIRHINWYTLFDDYPDKGNYNHFGLIEHSTSNTMKPRPSYFALQRLIALMSDPGPTFSTGHLNYEITGSDISDIRHLLFQKRDGRFFLMIWQDANSYNRTTFMDISVAPRVLTLALGQHVQSVRAFQPTLNASASHLASNATSVTLSVPDHLLIVEIVP